MAIRGRQGEDWDADELDAIIADYFVMLGDELAHRPYVKAHHRAPLMQLIGRSAASIAATCRPLALHRRMLLLGADAGQGPLLARSCR
jgi:hypothetical protein